MDTVKARDDPASGRLHPRLAELFAAFDEAGLSWCVLRGETELLSPAGDVDILVARANLPRMARIAEDLGLVRVPAWGYGSHSFFLTYDAPTDAWIKLDIVTELGFGPGFAFATGAEASCLSRRQYVFGIPVLSQADAFWALLLHRLLDKEGAVGARDAARLAELLPGTGQDSPLARVVDSVCPPGWNAERIIGEVQRVHWDSLIHLSPHLAAAWGRKRRTDVRRRRTMNDLRRWWGKWLGLRQRRGLGVALLGPDGAGKSTLAAGVERTFYFPARSVYMGLFQNPTSAPARRGIPGVGLAGRVATQWGRWIRGAYHRRRGRLVLFDRYSYDTLLPARSQGSRRVRAYRWLLAHSCPPPDLVVVLDAPSELLYARKGEHNMALLERERQAYRALLPHLPRAALVDASRDPEQVRPEVTAFIWGEYARRWSGPR